MIARAADGERFEVFQRCDQWLRCIISMNRQSQTGSVSIPVRPDQSSGGTTAEKRIHQAMCVFGRAQITDRIIPNADGDREWQAAA